MNHKGFSQRIILIIIAIFFVGGAGYMVFTRNVWAPSPMPVPVPLLLPNPQPLPAPSPVPTPNPSPTPISETKNILSQAHNAFGFEMFALIAQEEKENVFISPSSIAIALSMVYNGAQGIPVALSEFIEECSAILSADIQSGDTLFVIDKERQEEVQLWGIVRSFT